MKKLILPFVALLIGMAACQKEDTNVLTLEVEHYNGDAKMHIDNQDFAVWDNGDIVWLNGNEKQVSVNNTTHQATISAEGVSSTFFMEFYYASYPYISTISFSTNINITLPAVQTYKEVDGRQKVDAPMFAFASNANSTLMFRNIGSVLAVKVLNGTYEPIRVHSIRVTADNNQNLYGTGSISINDSESALSNLTNGGNTVTLNCGEEGVEVPDEGKVFYIALPTISDAHLTVKVDDGYGIYTLYQTNNTATFGRNTIHEVPFTASENICVDYDVRPQQDSRTIRYSATSKLTGFEENATVWEKTVISHVYNATSQRGTITFNSDITELPYFAFQWQSALLSIKLPESVKTIRFDAFEGCGSLASVSMPGVEFINEYAFEGCSSLTTLNCPSIKKIDKYAFKDSGLSTIILGPNCESLGVNIFYHCNMLAIYSKAPNPPESEIIGGSTHCFTAMWGTPILYVPVGKGVLYDSYSCWRNTFGMDRIVEIAEGDWPDD